MTVTPLVRLFAPVLSFALGCPTAHRPSAAPASAAPVIAFVDFHVIPMATPGVLERHTIIVRGDRIDAVGPVATVSIPADALRIEGEGKRYLVPGLVDTHVHLLGHPERWVDLFLAHGVTTVFNLRGGPSELALREAVRSGARAGPTIYTSGDFANLPMVTDAESARRLIKAQRQAGYDFVKIHGELSRESFAALMSEAKKEGIAVLGHAPRNLPFDAVLEERLPLLAHAEEIFATALDDSPEADRTTFPTLARRIAASGIRVTTTLKVYESLVSQWGHPQAVEAYLAQDARAKWINEELRIWWKHGNPYTSRTSDRAAMAKRLGHIRALVAELHRAGASLMVGSDSPMPLLAPGDALHDELDALRLLGLPAWDVLAAATVTPGEYIRQQVHSTERFGVIMPGARADLLVVDRNPIEDLSSLRSPAAVVSRGHLLTRQTLAERLTQVEREASARHGSGVPPVELERFAGNYGSPETPLQLSFKVADGWLVGGIVGQPGALPFASIGNGRFAAMGEPIEVEFSATASGGAMQVRTSREGMPTFQLPKVR
jgi:imidazolonepropionase-like amidohydrolase